MFNEARRAKSEEKTQAVEIQKKAAKQPVLEQVISSASTLPVQETSPRTPTPEALQAAQNALAQAFSGARATSRSIGARVNTGRQADLILMPEDVQDILLDAYMGGAKARKLETEHQATEAVARRKQGTQEAWATWRSQQAEGFPPLTPKPNQRPNGSRARQALS